MTLLKRLITKESICLVLRTEKIFTVKIIHTNDVSM